MKRKITTVLVIASVFIGTPFANAEIRPGSTCKKLGINIVQSGRKYTCIKSGNKLIWNKGEIIASPSSTLKPIPTLLQLTDLASFTDSSLCKLKNNSSSSQILSTGFPNQSDLLGKKQIEVLGLYVDFLDMPGKEEPKIDSTPIISAFNSYYEINSYRKLRINWTIPNKYYHLKNTVGFYQFSLESMNEKKGDWANIFRFPQDVINAADSEIDFSKFDSLIIFTPPQATDREIGDVSPGDLLGEIGYLSNEGVVRNIRTYVGSWRSPQWADPRLGNEYIWRGLVHEFGHILGLPDYYILDYINRFDSYVGQYDVMGVPQFGQAPELFAWSRWLLGWLDDKQVLCNTLKESLIEVSPIEVNDGRTKFVAIPLSKFQAIGIESRRAIGFDSKMSSVSEGVLVYKIDTSKNSQKGPIQLQSIRQNILGNSIYESNLFKDATLKKGESIMIDTIKITIVDSSSASDKIRIENKS